MASITPSGKSSVDWFSFAASHGPTGYSKETRKKVFFVVSGLLASMGALYCYRRYRSSKLLKGKSTSLTGERLPQASLVKPSAKEDKEPKVVKVEVDEGKNRRNAENRTPSPQHSFRPVSQQKALFTQHPPAELDRRVLRNEDSGEEEDVSMRERYRPETPDSAYGDGVVAQGTITKSSPSRSFYGNRTMHEQDDVPQINLDGGKE